MQYSKHVVSGVTWTTIQTLINRSSGFIVKMILARLLFPEDYGIVGMAVVFSGFFKSFTDLGFGSAIIQRDEEVINDTYLSTAFWSNIIWSLLSYLLLVFLISPFAASFYNESILIHVIPALGIPIITYPLFLVQRSVMTKNLNFKKIAVINNTASVVSGIIAVALAYFGFGVWALVAQSVIQSLIELPLYYKNSPWKPKWVFDKEAFRDMFGFGSFTTLSSLTYKFSSQGDYFLVGKILGKIELGLYSFAFILTDSIRIQVRQIIDVVMYPIYSKAKNDFDLQVKFLNKSILFNSLLISPIMGLLFISTEWVTILFGEKWIDSLLVIKLVSISVIIQILTNSFSTIMRANNKSYIEFKLQVIKVFVFYLPVIFIGTYYYGLIGCSVSVIIGRIFVNLINLWALKFYLRIPVMDLLVSFLRGIAPTVLSSILIYLLFIFSEFNLGTLVIKTILLLIIISVSSFMLNKSEIKNLLKTIKK